MNGLRSEMRKWRFYCAERWRWGSRETKKGVGFVQQRYGVGMDRSPRRAAFKAVAGSVATAKGWLLNP